MITYNEFLENVGVISEEKFNEIIKSFPEIEFNFGDIDPPDDLSSQTSIATEFINSILSNNWGWVCVYDVDFEDKTFELEDVQSLKDLREIKETFSLWTISNYERIEKDLIGTEKEESKELEKSKKYSLLNKLSDSLSLEELENLVKKYDKK